MDMKQFKLVKFLERKKIEGDVKNEKRKFHQNHFIGEEKRSHGVQTEDCQKQ